MPQLLLNRGLDYHDHRWVQVIIDGRGDHVWVETFGRNKQPWMCGGGWKRPWMGGDG